MYSTRIYFDGEKKIADAGDHPYIVLSVSNPTREGFITQICEIIASYRLDHEVVSNMPALNILSDTIADLGKKGINIPVLVNEEDVEKINSYLAANGLEAISEKDYDPKNKKRCLMRKGEE